MGIGLDILIQVSTNFLCRQTQFVYAKTKTVNTVRCFSNSLCGFQNKQSSSYFEKFSQCKAFPKQLFVSRNRFRNEFTFQNSFSKRLFVSKNDSEMIFCFEKRFGNVFPYGSCSVNKSLDSFICARIVQLNRCQYCNVQLAMRHQGCPQPSFVAD